MNTYRKTAIITGILFLAGYLGIFLGSAFYAPILDAPDYLSQIYPNKSQVITGMLIELINDVAVIGIPVMLFPILKKYSDRLALGYFGFRLIESMVLILSKTSLLSLITLSQEYIAAGSPENSYFQTFGAVALAERDWASQIQVVFFVLSAVIFYFVLYQTKLLPRWLSVWGFIAVACLIAANVLPVSTRSTIASATPSATMISTEPEMDTTLLEPDEAVLCSAKTGEGIEDVLEAIVERLPPPPKIEHEPQKPAEESAPRVRVELARLASFAPEVLLFGRIESPASATLSS